MNELLRWSVLLWAGLAILLHLGLVLGWMRCRTSSWSEHPWRRRAEQARLGLAVMISGLFLLALLTGCVNPCPCRPKVPPDRIYRMIQTPTLDSALDLGIGIECQWMY